MTIEQIIFEIAKVGGFAAIGGVIDFLMSKSAKKRLREFLETWWYRFNEVRWRNFGHAEARLAISYFDMFAGRRFFSLKRLKAKVYILLFGLCAILPGMMSSMAKMSRAI